MMSKGYEQKMMEINRGAKQVEQAMNDLQDQKRSTMDSITARHSALNNAMSRMNGSSEQLSRMQSETSDALSEIDRMLSEL